MDPLARHAPLLRLDVVSSTNDTILDAGEADAPEGTAHLARAQTRGRGRGGHSWWSPPGAGLWMSVLLRPTRERDRWSGLSLVAGRAVRDAIADLGVPGIGLYWPNDLEVGGRKIGGILGEARTRGHRTWLALGIGVNLDFRGLRDSMPAVLRDIATSIAEAGSPATIDPVEIARRILARFWDLYERFEDGEELADILGDALSHVGRRVTVRLDGGPSFRGSVAGLGPSGELLVRLEDPRDAAAGPPAGTHRTADPGVVAVTAGDVSYDPGGGSGSRGAEPGDGGRRDRG